MAPHTPPLPFWFKVLFRRWQMWLNGPFAEEHSIAGEKTAKRPNARCAWDLKSHV